MGDRVPGKVVEAEIRRRLDCDPDVFATALPDGRLWVEAPLDRLLSAALDACPVIGPPERHLRAAWAACSGYPPKDDAEIALQLEVAEMFQAALRSVSEEE